jgi:hypothetical protein
MLRSAVVTLALVLGLWGSALAAEKSVGVVLSGDLPRYQEAHKAFVNALARRV